MGARLSTTRGVASLVAAFVVGMVTAHPVAATTTVSYTDPIGDARYHAPGYADEVRVDVTREGDTLTFVMTLAAPLPSEGRLPPPATNELAWVFGLDTDPSSNPAGFPLAPGYSVQADFTLRVDWDGELYMGRLIDRRPLVTGGEAIVTSVPFTIDSNRLSMSVTIEMLGGAEHFMFDAVTSMWSGREGSLGRHFTDALDPFFNPTP